MEGWRLIATGEMNRNYASSLGSVKRPLGKTTRKACIEPVPGRGVGHGPRTRPTTRPHAPRCCPRACRQCPVEPCRSAGASALCVCGPFQFAITVLRRRRLPAFDGHPQALRHAVDPDDASRAKHPGALHRELPDWAATPHSDRITQLESRSSPRLCMSAPPDAGGVHAPVQAVSPEQFKQVDT